MTPVTHSMASIVFAALLGFGLQLTFAWREWVAITKSPHSLVQYIREDVPGFVSAILLSAAAFLVLPEIGQIGWVRNTLGFTPQRTPMSALATSFLFSVLGYQWRAILAKWTRVAPPGPP